MLFLWIFYQDWARLKVHLMMTFFFWLMEFLQLCNYLVGVENAPWASEEPGCQVSNFRSVVLVFLGYLHICLQPFVIHWIQHEREKIEKGPDHSPGMKYVLRLIFVGALWDFSNMFQGLAMFFYEGGYNHDVSVRETMKKWNGVDFDWNTCAQGQQLVKGAVGERGIWLLGNEWCAFQGGFHLGWEFPMQPPNYYRNGHVHFFCFFAPYLIHGSKKQVVNMLILLFTGPLLAEYLASNSRSEAASTWCIMHLGQVFLSFLGECVIQPMFGKPYPKVKDAKKE